MSVKLRLQRHGRKGKPFYWIVAADGRDKRDGRYLEKIGVYSPTENPAYIELDVDQAVVWLQNGAQPSDTVRRILSYKGALLKNHLAGGVRKGALTEEQAVEKFNAWIEEKNTQIDEKKQNISKADADAKAKVLADAEKLVAEKQAALDAERKAAEEAEAAAKAEADAAAKAEADAAKAAEAKTEEE